MEKSTGKNIKQKASAAVATAGILIGGVLSPPANLPPEQLQDRIEPPPAIEIVIADEQSNDDDDDVAITEEEKKRRGKFISWYASRKLGARLAISIGVSLFGWAVFAALYVAYAAVLPAFVRFILRTVLIAFLGLSTYALIAKAFLPDVPLSKILNWKVICAVVVLACIVSFGLKFLFSTIIVQK